MASAALVNRVAKTATLAPQALGRMQKHAFFGAAWKGLSGLGRGLGNLGRGAVGAAPKFGPMPTGVPAAAAAGATVPTAAAAANPLMYRIGASTPFRLGAAGAGLYGAGLGTYHGLGWGKPGDPNAQFDQHRGFAENLEGQFQGDIDAVRAGTYNPLTGARANSLWSGIFGFQGLSPAERDQQIASMEEKLRAARAGTGDLGNYRGTNWSSTTHSQARQQALDAANQGVNKGTHSPGLYQRMMFDGSPRTVSDDAASAMREFISKYGPKKNTPSAASRFSFIGGRPTGPVDFSHLGMGTGFGHDYSGYYQPYGMVGR